MAVWLPQLYGPGPAVCQAEGRAGDSRSPGGLQVGGGKGARKWSPRAEDPSGLFPEGCAGAWCCQEGRQGVRAGRVPVGERSGSPGPAQGQKGRRVGRQSKGGRPGGPTCPQGPGEESRLHSTPWGRRPPCCGRRAWGKRGRGLGLVGGAWEHVGGAWEHVDGAWEHVGGRRGRGQKQRAMLMDVALPGKCEEGVADSTPRATEGAGRLLPLDGRQRLGSWATCLCPFWAWGFPDAALLSRPRGAVPWIWGL